MLTPQEVSTHSFTKAVMGGYNMAMVDEFLDELTDDYTALYKENAALKAKMKVLVEKVEDYRATEDSMRATLLTAQKMADSIVHEAEAKRDALLSRAEMDAREKIAQLQKETEAVQERLRQGQEELARFIADRETTTTVSNLGRVTLDERLARHVRSVSFLTTPASLNFTVCSFGDDLSIGISTIYHDLNVIKNLCRILAAQGISGRMNIAGVHVEKGASA